MRVFIYDELEKERKEPSDSKRKQPKESDTVELNAGDFNRAIDGTYEKGIFTWTEGGFHFLVWSFGKKTKNMDILFNKTKRLPLGKKGEEVNCARAVFDGMNFVQIGWGLNSTISKEERQLSRANLVRDYENMKLSDENKLTKPTDFLENLLPWLVIIACIIAVVATLYNANSMKDVMKPMLQNMSALTQQNAAMIHILANTLKINVG